MAYFDLIRITISYEGEEPAIEAFQNALKAGKSGAVKKAQNYFERNGFETDYENRRFNVQGSELELPQDVLPMLLEFPAVAFIFDTVFEGDAAGCAGVGRYYCVYEKGKKVYDADSWVEEWSFLNEWLVERGVDGDFYDMEEEEALSLIARARLAEEGKKPEDITDEDIEDYLDNHNIDYGIGMVYDSEYILYDHDFRWWAEFLCDQDDLFEFYSDENYGYDDYIKCKKKRKLPCLNARSRGKRFCDIGEPDADDVST